MVLSVFSCTFSPVGKEKERESFKKAGILPPLPNKRLTIFKESNVPVFFKSLKHCLKSLKKIHKIFTF